MSADIDKAIDRAVRDMLDVEPPAGLRRRVMDRIADRPADAPPRLARTLGWVALPLAAAAVLFAVLPQSKPVPRAHVATANVEQPHAPAATSPAPAPIVPAPGNRTMARASRPRVAPPARIGGGTAPTPEPATIATIEALEGPASIAVGRLPGPAAPTLSSIEPAPMHVEALEVPALPQPPRERREE